ncbi:MAG: putative molybdenum carrier protein [Rhodospirillaceae bacterium]
MKIEVWSCGQTGVAQGALSSAKHCGVPTNGWMAQGFQTEAGPAPTLAETYGLHEYSRPGELQPIRRNVKESEATLWIAAPPRVETDRSYWATRKAVATYGHPLLLIPAKLKAADAARQIALWVTRWDVTRLHVMGPRASLWPGAEERAVLVLTEALHALGSCRGPRLALAG